MIIPLTYKISCLLPRRPYQSAIASVVIFDIIDLSPNLKVITFHFSFGFRFLTMEMHALPAIIAVLLNNGPWPLCGMIFRGCQLYFC